MLRRPWPWFYAFDVLGVNGEDRRTLPLLERKRRLRGIMPSSNAGCYIWITSRSGDAICSGWRVNAT
jgi:ATP-dependent DNA ligase